jgi:hypothetical protein
MASTLPNLMIHAMIVIYNQKATMNKREGRNCRVDAEETNRD